MYNFVFGQLFHMLEINIPMRKIFSFYMTFTKYNCRRIVSENLIGICENSILQASCLYICHYSYIFSSDICIEILAN